MNEIDMYDQAYLKIDKKGNLTISIRLSDGLEEKHLAIIRGYMLAKGIDIGEELNLVMNQGENTFSIKLGKEK